MAFGVLFALLGAVGLVLYDESKPVSVNLLVKTSRPKIDVFVSDPRATVKLSVEVGGPSSALAPDLTTHEAAIYVSVIPPTPTETVFLLVFLQGDATDTRASLVSNYFDVPGQRPRKMSIFAANTALNFAGPETKLGHYLTTVKVPGVFRSADGELQAQLPILNYLFLPHAQQFVARSCDLTDAQTTQPFTPDVINWTGARLSVPSCGPRTVFRPNEKAFYSPSNLISREQLDVNTGGYQILEDIPTGGGTAVAETADWEGVADLAPAITAVRPNVQEGRSRNSFLAGVVLAIAGAALIAALQEVRRPRLARATPKRSKPDEREKAPRRRQSSLGESAKTSRPTPPPRHEEDHPGSEA